MPPGIFTVIATLYGVIAIILFLTGISVLRFPEFWWKAQKIWLIKTGIRAQKTKLWDIVLRRTAIILIIAGILFSVLSFLLME